MFHFWHDQTIPQGSVGLLYERGCFVQTLSPGRYRIWNTFRHQTVVLVAVVRQLLQLAGQEILTTDHVPVRLTLTVDFQINDAVKATHQVQSWYSQLYSDLQIALRDRVAVLNFDQTLDQKTSLGEQVQEAVAPLAAEYGIQLLRVALRDITMPASIRDMMLKTVEAERSARASLIKAREEVSAARARVNAARLMSENPAVLRLKELETLTELARSPGSTIVFAGQTDLTGLALARTR